MQVNNDNLKRFQKHVNASATTVTSATAAAHDKEERDEFVESISEIDNLL